MESKHQIYLVENRTKSLCIEHRRLATSKKVLYLISGIPTHFRAFPKSTYDDAVVASISNAFKQLTEQTASTWFSISITTTKLPSDDDDRQFRVSLDVQLNEKLRSELNNILFKPKLNIIGEYTFDAYGISEPEKFQVLDIELSASQSVRNFTGAPTLQDNIRILSYNSNQFNLDFNYSVLLEWERNVSKRKRVKALDRLFNEKLLADCSIIPSNLKAVPCHRNVLSAISDFFHTKLTNKMEEPPTNQISMEHMSEEAVNAVLAFIYEQELGDLNTETAIEVFKAAHECNIPALEDDMKELLHKTQEKNFGLSAALDLYFFAVNVGECDLLCKKLLQIFKRNSSQLRSLSDFQELVHRDPTKAIDLLFKLIEI